MTRNVALGQPTVGEEELAAVADVFASGWLSGAGPACVALESDFAAVAGVDHVLATSNCGSALHLALLALGSGPGDEVIVGDYTFPATGHSVMWTGARPVFADVRPDIWSLDPAAVEAAITPRTVGIVAVDVFGQPADYDELRAIADKHGLWLLEDAACAAGATYKGRPAGSLADAAAFSFHGRKGITAGEMPYVCSLRAWLARSSRSVVSAPPSPAVMPLRPWKLNVATSASEPAGRPL
ncbi:MAG TPA: aminotransferase class I/II-fold pyridoxal phosphate-dependent enzyme [Microbacterium sp.]|nr:aminotransferase class I/II-fold pyridoxal phosphate-dependent enzyme [Microbacterium sp.]